MVVTTMKPLLIQLKETLRKHKFLETGVSVMHSGELLRLDDSSIDLFILDEADELTRTIAVKFD